MRTAIGVLLLAATLVAGSYRSPNGKHRLEIEGDTFRLLAGKTVVAEGTLDYRPLHVHVLDGEPGAILFGTASLERAAITLARLDRDGRLRWKTGLDVLFDAGTIRRFTERKADLPWHRTWWVDEERGRVVLVSIDDHLRAVALDTGATSTPKAEIVLEAFRLPWARFDALQVAARLRPKGVREAAEPFVRDESLPQHVRFAAAHAFRMARVDWWKDAFDKAKSPGNKRLALRGLLQLLEDDALDYLEREALSRTNGVYAVEGLAALGDEGARAMIGLLSHEDAPDEVKTHVVNQIRRLPSGVAFAALDRELKRAYEDAALAGRLIHAAVVVDPGRAVRRLQNHEAALILALDRETGPVWWLVDYFKARPTSEATKPLLKALARYRHNPNRLRIIAALKACTGQNFGEDVEAWLRRTRAH